MPVFPFVTAFPFFTVFPFFFLQSCLVHSVAAPQAPGMHSPMYELLSLPTPVRPLTLNLNPKPNRIRFIPFLELFSQFCLNSKCEGERCQLRPIPLPDCYSWRLSVGVGQRYFRPGSCLGLLVTPRPLLSRLKCELCVQLGFGESIQQQVGPWKLSLPGITQPLCVMLQRAR